jgi:CRISPR-associated protein Cmr4
MTTKVLCLFTHTPLHVGAGASVGAIDQPIQRERHTGFPIIPASSLKGSFADHWNCDLLATDGGKKVRVTKDGASSVPAWLFGSDSDQNAFAGSLLFSEARVLAFPVRSAKGSFAWITCPLMLQRAKRDGVIASALPPEPSADDQAIFKSDGPLAIGQQVVLEDYCLQSTGAYTSVLANEIAALLPYEEIFQSIKERLVILSNGMMTHFVTTTCEVAQHVRISDETGTAEGTGLFNQENVPSETLFYSVLGAKPSRKETNPKTGDDAIEAFKSKVEATKVFQFGGDASTGLGFCTVTLKA